MSFCRKTIFIIFLCSLGIPESQARFQWASNVADCVESETIHSTFIYTNTSRDIEIIVPTNSKPQTGSCWLIKYPTKPMNPGDSAKVTLQCSLMHPDSNGVFHKSTPILIRRIDSVTRIESTLTVSLNSSGRISKHCEPREPYRSLCSDFRLDEKDQPLAKVPLKIQHFVGACYAATATTLFDYMRTVDGESVTDPSSMLAAALDYKTYLDPKTETGPFVLDGGKNFQLLDFLMQEGACSHSSVAGNLQLNSLSENHLNRIYAFLTLRLEQLRIKMKSTSKMNVSEINQCVSNFKSDFKNDLITVNELYHQNQCVTDGFLNHMGQLIGRNPELACLSLSTLKNEFPLACKESDRKVLKNHWEIEKRQFNLAGFKGTQKPYLENAFFNATEKHPVQVGFPTCMLNAYDPSQSFEAFSQSYACKNQMHSAILVGQHWNKTKNRCEVILRNSQRTLRCESYSGWDCDLERGTVNLDQELFYQMVRDAVLIRKKP